MKKLLAIALLISMGPLCAMEADDAVREAWMKEPADATEIAQFGGFVEAARRTEGYWQEQLAIFSTSPNGCTNGDLRTFWRYFEEENEVGCRAHFKASHPVAVAAFSPASPPVGSGRGARRKLRHSGKDRKLLCLSKLGYLTAMGGTAMVAGGAYAARRHIKVRHAKGEKTVFDRMGQWVQQRYRRLVRSKKTTSETTA